LIAAGTACTSKLSSSVLPVPPVEATRKANEVVGLSAAAGIVNKPSTQTPPEPSDKLAGVIPVLVKAPPLRLYESVIVWVPPDCLSIWKYTLKVL
jgi:hypothetical protein